MKFKAYGKINLALDVVRKRPDGYHDVKMVMQTVKIYDDIEIKKNTTGNIAIKTNLFFLPTDEKNLMYKAAKLLIDEFNIKEGVDIELKKVIPVSAGMAGGSSDAATVLYGMNKMFRLGLSTKELMKRGVKLGADVPYCIIRGTALSEGIGDELTRLSPPPKLTVLVVKPKINVSTAYVYKNLKLDELERHPDIDAMVKALEDKNIDQIGKNMENVLESVTENKYPVIKEIKTIMKENGAVNALMSGSGPTVFGIYRTNVQAEKTKNIIMNKNITKQIFVTKFYNPRNEYY